jgi:hypothetical protein
MRNEGRYTVLSSKLVVFVCAGIAALGNAVRFVVNSYKAKGGAGAGFWHIGLGSERWGTDANRGFSHLVALSFSGDMF